MNGARFILVKGRPKANAWAAVDYRSAGAALTLGSRIAQLVLAPCWNGARVAEWQTRRTQNPLPSRAWGFGPPRARKEAGKSVIHRPKRPTVGR